MDNPLDDIIQMAGLNPSEFRPEPVRKMSVQVTNNPIIINNALSQPDTVYAAIEEDNSIVPDTELHIIETHTNRELSDDDYDEIFQEVGFENMEPATTIVEDAEEWPMEDVDGLLSENSSAAGAVAVAVSSSNSEELEGVYEHLAATVDAAIVESYNNVNKEVPNEEGLQESSLPLEPHILHIEKNSPTLLVDDSTSRFSGTEWYNAIQETSIILAGIGGIGSYCAYQLARMKPKTLLLYDNDVVELANMSGQLFSREDVGTAKVNAITKFITNYTTANNVFAIRGFFDDKSAAGDIMICGFDNMKARKTFFESWKKHVLNKPEEERYKCLYLDGRLSIDTLQVFCITGEDFCYMKEYEEDYLFFDEEADETICSLKQTTYMACMIASMMTNLFTNFIANTLNPVIPYDLPFFTEYDAQNMIFKTKK